MTDHTPQPCHHTRRHEHGQRATYVADKCRCEPCTTANRSYEDRRRRAQIYGHTNLVDAEPVREHLRALMGAGLPHKRIAQIAGVSRGVVTGVLYGQPVIGRAPSKRIRPKAAAALLAVTPPRTEPKAPSVPPPAPARPVLRPVPHTPRRGSLADLTDPDTDWRTSALCAQTNPDEWFPDKGGSARPAKKICLRCPVREECLEVGLRTGDQFGIYGGLTYRQRAKHPRYRSPQDDRSSTA